MNSASRDKVCALCGQDCSRRKRVKDARGRYFCLDCFERRLEAVQRKREREFEAVRESLLDESGSSTFGVDRELVAIEAESVAHEQAKRPVPCVGCGELIDPDVVLCIHCGHDYQAGTQLTVQKRVLSRERPAAWPKVVGALCLLFGVAGLVAYGGVVVDGVKRLVGEDPWSDLTYAIVFSGGAALVLLSIVHIFAGVLVWMQFAAGVNLLRFWLWGKLLLWTLVALGGGVAAFAFPAVTTNFELLDYARLSMEQKEPLGLAKLLAAVWVWQCAWPLVLLFHFEGEQVQKDIKEWDEPLEKSTALYD